MNMTFDEYIKNPAGIKNAVYSHREMYRNLYIEKLDKIMLRETGKIDYTLYKSKNEYYVHMKIPSEVVPQFYYDTVVMFYTDNKEISVSKSLSQYYVKFYSNDPSFVYTFAHAMLENDLFIRDLVPRMSKQAVLKVAKVKNPKNEIGYVKSLYFLYLLMKRDNLFDKLVFESRGKAYNKKQLLKNITHADHKIQARQNAQDELSKKNKREKTKLNIPKETRNPNIVTKMVSKTKKITTPKKISSSNKAKTIKKI